MMAGSHVLLGMLAWEWAAPKLGLAGARPDGIALAAIGALLPDIDHPRSWTGRRTWPVSAALARIAGHRGVTHSLLAALGGALLLRHLSAASWIAAPLLTGYLSHLAGDLVTPAGLRLTWPLRRTYAFPLCRTGGFSELVLLAVVLVVGCALLVGQTGQHWPGEAAGGHRIACCARRAS